MGYDSRREGLIKRIIGNLLSKVLRSPMSLAQYDNIITVIQDLILYTIVWSFLSIGVIIIGSLSNWIVWMVSGILSPIVLLTLVIVETEYGL